MPQRSLGIRSKNLGCRIPLTKSTRENLRDLMKEKDLEWYDDVLQYLLAFYNTRKVKKE